ncbi:MAG: ACP S-malonyltransferase [Deltaproteobacteria bacterium]|jgi:[acyl-carrier-protein] S-malonyltransferase|nr:ACP S-malonyltransferase [Pseudomonadota bacterium]MCK5185866.1 ACP S-malonyltransferase [Deltaproteobacteria bacterium]MCK5513100.1 ACP S-malonyltransferase [Deltaproteobacteria bacterium]
MSETAFIFPGQGAQYIGMGKELADNFKVARETFQEADEALKFSISSLCFNGPEEELKLTPNTQPAILTASIAALRVLSSETGINPVLLAGHSLGEYSSLITAQALNFSDAVQIVRLRGKFMQEAVPAGEGTMAAILGLEADEVQDICRQSAQEEVVSPANFNSSWQIVISGHTEAVSRAVENALERGAKKAVMLAVSAPFHCSLMKPAAEKLKEALQDVPVCDIHIPVISNADARPYPSKEEIKNLLVKQVNHPVRWEESMREMVAKGVKTVIEIGPGKVLTGLMRRITKEVKTLNLEDLKGLKEISQQNRG